MSATASTRFWARVDIGDCWEWTGQIDRDGYGQFGISRGQKAQAHRWSWEFLVGPVGAGLQLDHLCRNRRCVNPDHLEPVTCAENVRRGAIGHRSRSTDRCPKDHLYNAENTRLHKGHRICRECNRAANRDWYRRTRGRAVL